MAHVWKRSDDSWQAHLLVEEKSNLAGDALLLVRTGDARRPTWVLLSSPKVDITINGYLTAGMRLLADRDEIRVTTVDGPATFFLSTERLAIIEPFPGAERPLFCPRCKQEILAGMPAVQCPQCGVWHHETDSLPCWTYTKDHCALCAQPTELGGTYQWSPEEL